MKCDLFFNCPETNINENNKIFKSELFVVYLDSSLNFCHHHIIVIEKLNFDYTFHVLDLSISLWKNILYILIINNYKKN